VFGLNRSRLGLTRNSVQNYIGEELMGFFRVRFRCSSGDFSRRAWEKSVIGIWYGAWGPERFSPALKSPDPAKYLSSLPQQKKLGWEITSGSFSVAKRFYALTEQDWVFTYSMMQFI
jgi:hypothetical protein